jgi:hypothetical protein
MVMNTSSGSLINQQARVRLEPVIYNNSQPPPFLALGDGDKDRSSIGSPDRRLDTTECKIVAQEARTVPSRGGDRQEDAGDLSKVIAELERMCTYMEMERKGKNRSIVVDKLLMGTDE